MMAKKIVRGGSAEAAHTAALFLTRSRLASSPPPTLSCEEVSVLAEVRLLKEQQVDYIYIYIYVYVYIYV